MVSRELADNGGKNEPVCHDVILLIDSAMCVVYQDRQAIEGRMRVLWVLLLWTERIEEETLELAEVVGMGPLIV